ncbi:MAG: PIG-L family deacetylase, partial [bacterium]|nr:PIG-L family deacetylase [bacterium]
GPARAMFKQRRQGHEVYLLTLTKGGATKQRFKYELSVQRMGEVRYQEMLNVEKVLDLSGMRVLDLPDSGLKEMDPRDIENVITDEIHRVQPQVVVTYPVHGISGFHDHLVSHAVVKRVFLEIKEKEPWLKRLAFHTVTEAEAEQSTHFKLNPSKEEEIDCILEVDPIDVERNLEALDCYITFQDTIKNSGIREAVLGPMYFEFFGESLEPPVGDLFAGLDENEP